MPTVDEAFLWDIGDFAEDEEQFRREWGAVIRALSKALIKRKIQVLTAAMHHADMGQTEENEIRELSDRLKALEKEG